MSFCAISKTSVSFDWFTTCKTYICFNYPRNSKYSIECIMWPKELHLCGVSLENVLLWSARKDFWIDISLHIFLWFASSRIFFVIRLQRHFNNDYFWCAFHCFNTSFIKWWLKWTTHIITSHPLKKRWIIEDMASLFILGCCSDILYQTLFEAHLSQSFYKKKYNTISD